MSTTAILFIKKENGKYDGVTVNFDGYIRIVQRTCFRNKYIEGLGWTLNNYWNCYSEAKKLCSSKNHIRCIDGNDIEFYPESCKDLKNLSEKEMEKRRQNYCYSYVYRYSEERKDYAWIAGKSGYEGMFFLDQFFEDPESYSNEEDWWECYG